MMLLWAGVLCLLAALFVLAPWWLHGRDRQAGGRREAAVAVVGARLEELAREHREGLLDDAAYAQLKLEQERALLRDARETGAVAALGGRGALLAAALAVPVCALLFYAHFGAWADWNIQRLLERSEQQLQAGEDNRATLEDLTRALERRLAQRDDDDGRRRFMLARIHSEFGRYDAALIQYRLLQRQFPDDPDISAQYAQALYIASDRKLTDEVRAQAERALRADPDQATALGLLGIAAFESRDYAQALLHWRHLLRLLPPGSPNAGMIEHGIAQAEQALGPGGFPGPKITVAVSLAPELAGAQPAGAKLLVFARAVGGPPMPLAVARLDAARLPLEVTLDDSMAMAPGMNLSSAKQVEVVARVSASGQARAEAGDLEGSSGPLTLGQGDKTGQRLSLQIDRRL